MSKPVNRILLVSEKYCETKPANGPPITDWLILTAINSTGLVSEIKNFHYDDIGHKVGQYRMEQMLIETCQVAAPDLIIFSRSAGQPNPAIMKVIADELHIPILNYFVDAKFFSDLRVHAFPWCTHVGIVDNVAAFRAHRNLGNVILMYCAADPSTFYDTHMSRDIDVSFLGSIDPTDTRLPMRSEYLNYLLGRGINLVITGGQRQSTRMSIEYYADHLNLSKMTIDFCRDGDMIPCLKTRVFEALNCNTLLLEDAGSEAQHFFVPGYDYVEYTSKEDLENKIRYYLAHEDERKAIAQAGHDKAIGLFNARNLWGYTFEEMGFKIPEDLVNDNGYQIHKMTMRYHYD